MYINSIQRFKHSHFAAQNKEPTQCGPALGTETKTTNESFTYIEKPESDHGRNGAVYTAPSVQERKNSKEHARDRFGAVAIGVYIGGETKGTVAERMLATPLSFSNSVKNIRLSPDFSVSQRLP